MKIYNWIKIGCKCKWNDTALSDYSPIERKYYKDNVWVVYDIFHEDEENEEIFDDTIILISNGYSEAEVYPHEIVEIK